MQKLLSPQFKTKYLGTEKVDTFIGLTLSCTSCKEPARMMQHVCSDTRPEPSNIGFIVSSPTGLPDCGMVIGRDARVVCLPRIYKSYETNSSALPGTWDTAKISGMGSYYRTTLRRSTLFRSVYGNARGCSTSLDSVSKDRVASPAKLTPNCRSHLKKLLPVAERPRHPALVRGRSPFPAAQQSDTNVGSQRAATPCALAFVPRQSGLLRGTRPQNGKTAGQRSPHLQRRDLWRLCRLSSSIHPWKNLPHSGQREMAQSESPERAILHESGPYSPLLFTTLFPRTQPCGASLANHSQTGYPQSLLPIKRGFESVSDIQFFEMGAAKLHTQKVMRKHLRRYI
jgi:hypothetical protein